MKLLILTQYFPPEVGAPQNRLYALARHLQRMGVEVVVWTAMPNYPQMKIHDAYAGKKYVREEMDGIEVHRSFIFVTKSPSVIHRLRTYFSFVFSSAIQGIRHLQPVDFILCESPPLFLGYSAMFLARRKKAKLIFNVSDLWPESAEKLGVVTNRFLLWLAYRLEAKLYRRSALVTGQTQGICTNISVRFPAVKTYWLPNGADLKLFDPLRTVSGQWRRQLGLNSNDKIFLYAGIIGLAQGLEVILECARHFITRDDIKFVLLGNGPEKEKLEAIRTEYRLTNVIMIDAVPRSEIPSVLADTAATIVPLRRLPVFLGAIPSKIFESLAMEVPVILGVDGEARALFADTGCCALYFEPGDAVALAQSIEKVVDSEPLRREMGLNGRRFVQEHFNRETIALNFLARLRQL